MKDMEIKLKEDWDRAKDWPICANNAYSLHNFKRIVVKSEHFKHFWYFDFRAVDLEPKWVRCSESGHSDQESLIYESGDLVDRMFFKVRE